MNNQNQQDNQKQQNDIRSEIQRPYNQQNGYQRQPSR